MEGEFISAIHSIILFAVIHGAGRVGWSQAQTAIKKLRNILRLYHEMRILRYACMEARREIETATVMAAYSHIRSADRDFNEAVTEAYLEKLREQADELRQRIQVEFEEACKILNLKEKEESLPGS